MQIDLNKYRVNASFIQNWYKDHPDENVETMITIWAIALHCPIIILAHFLSEDIGYTPELVDLIDRQTKYYGYKEILGQLPGSPYLTFGKKEGTLEYFESPEEK